MSRFITKLTVTDDVCLITLSNLPQSISYATDILTKVAEAGINIDMINLSPYVKSGRISVSFTLLKDDLTKAMNVLGSFKENYPKLSYEIITDNTKLCVYGEYMPDKCGVAAEFLRLLEDTGIELRLITTSVVDISVLIAQHNADTVVSAIQKYYGI